MNFSIFLLIFFLLFASIISFLVFSLPLTFIERKMDSEKLSAYECGFMPFDDARGIFDIKFYLVSMLFLIFDIEIVFLFPWSISLNFLNFESVAVILLFFIVLIIGFIYEWKRGALNWNVLNE